MGVDDEPRDLVFFVRNQRLVEKLAQRNIGKAELCSDVLFCSGRRQPGEFIAGAERGGFGQELVQRTKRVSA